jgi:hypothetical protein
MSLKADLLKIVIRDPKMVFEGVKRGGRSILVDDFDANSPIARLPEEIGSRIFSHEITFPPLRLLEDGNQSLDGMAALVGLAQLIGARTIFEIGTYNGVMAYTLAQNLPHVHVHTLDLPPEKDPVLPLEAGDDYHIQARTSRVYENTAVSSRITQHYGDSAEFDFEPYVGACELVYIDGAHSYEYVKNDTQIANRLLNHKGAIVWDDYWMNVSGVPEYLHSLDAEERALLYRIPRTRLVVRLALRTS